MAASIVQAINNRENGTVMLGLSTTKRLEERDIQTQKIVYQNKSKPHTHNSPRHEE
jgi:hypothetical protein